MRKSIIVPSITVLLTVGAIIFLKDGWTYLMCSLMALSVMAFLKMARKWTTKVTRWGKANPGKAQLLITLLQVLIALLGIMAGYNFKKLGYELSATTAIVFSCITVACFLTVPFLRKRNTIPLPAQLNKHRWAFVGIALSSFMMMIVFGNRIGDTYPDSFIANSLEGIDQTIFPHNNRTLYTLENVAPISSLNHHNTFQSDASSNVAVFASFPIPDTEKAVDKTEKKLDKKELRAMKRLQKMRMAAAAGMSAGAIILLILLVPVLCAGICLIIAGLSGEAALGTLLLGLVVTAGSIWGMIKLIQGKRNDY